LPGSNPYCSDISKAEIDHLVHAITAHLQGSGSTYDVLFACYWLSGIVGLELKKTFQRKLLVSFCSLGYFKQMACTSGSLEPRIEIEKFIASQADHIIAASREEWEILANVYHVSTSKLSIIPRGVDLDVFQPAS